MRTVLDPKRPHPIPPCAPGFCINGFLHSTHTPPLAYHHPGSGSISIYPVYPRTPGKTTKSHHDNGTRSFRSEAATCLLWCLPFEPDERMDPHRMCSTHRLVRRKAFVITSACLACYCNGAYDGFHNRSAYVLLACLPKPDVFPAVHADFGPYLSFDLNYATIWATTTELYYFILTPGAAVSHSTTIGHTHITNAREI